MAVELQPATMRQRAETNTQRHSALAAILRSTGIDLLVTLQWLYSAFAADWHNRSHELAKAVMLGMPTCARSAFCGRHGQHDRAVGACHHVTVPQGRHVICEAWLPSCEAHFFSDFVKQTANNLYVVCYIIDSCMRLFYKG